MPASYFDVDGTLVGTNVVSPTLYYLLHLGSPVRAAAKLAHLAWRAPALAFAELVDRRTFNELLYESFAGLGEERLRWLADDVDRRLIAPAVLDGAEELVERHRRLGHRIVLVSGVLDFMLAPLARRLGADHVISNRLEMKNRVATGKLLSPVVAGPEKARLVREDARAHGDDLEQCYAYGDSHADLPMLSVVGHPTAVNPDARLRLLARAYRWPIFTMRRRPAATPPSVTTPERSSSGGSSC